MNVGQLRNYYEILGVSRNANNDEIKKSFRRLARLYHPDINPGDKTAEEKFKDINEAYDILLDETKRADFEQKFFSKDKRRSANGLNKGKGSKSFDFWKSQDFVPGKTKRAKVVNPSRSSRRDVEAKLTLPFEKAYRGGRERIRLEDGRSLEVDMPTGMVDGQKIRLKGQGIDGGNLYLKISIIPHPFWEIRGTDIFCRIPVTPSEAILGGAIEIPTIDGLVKMTVPPGVKPGQRLRLANKGYPDEQGLRGDQLVEIEIAIPPDPPAEELALYEKLRQLEAFNPRQNLIQ